jgi:hypothetical protein
MPKLEELFEEWMGALNLYAETARANCYGRSDRTSWAGRRYHRVKAAYFAAKAEGRD